MTTHERPLTEGEKQTIEDNWKLVLWAVRRMVEKGLVRTSEYRVALDSASSTAVSAVKSWQPERAQIGTYLTAAIWKNAYRDINDYREKEYQRTQLEPRQARHGISVVQDHRRPDQEKVDHEDACERIWVLLDRLERADPLTGKVMKMRARGKTDSEIAEKLGVSKERANQRTRKGRLWLGLRLGIPTKATDRFDEDFAWWGTTQRTHKALKREPRLRRKRKQWKRKYGVKA